MSPKKKIIVVLKGYPRLSETFIAQELLGLERAGFDLAMEQAIKDKRVIGAGRDTQ